MLIFAMEIENLNTMDRLEFCTKMTELRKESHYTIKYMVIHLDMDGSQIIRIENGSTNFSMERGILYLSILNCKIIISKNGVDKDIPSEDEAINLFSYIRKNENLTYTSFGIPLGLTATYVKRIENKNSSLKIDIFLKMAEKFGYNILIVKNN
jgi:transcriptional regulator with XRE-family HTH domain